MSTFLSTVNHEFRHARPLKTHLGLMLGTIYEFIYSKACTYPIVGLMLWSKWSWTNLQTILDFPTPVSCVFKRGNGKHCCLGVYFSSSRSIQEEQKHFSGTSFFSWHSRTTNMWPRPKMNTDVLVACKISTLGNVLLGSLVIRLGRNLRALWLEQARWWW